MLPWWLKHHTELFDHGILIDRNSTDNSVEICKKIAPHWEIRTSKVPNFDPIEVDREVMNIEMECSEWKMILNTTEFLCFRDKEEFFSFLNNLGEEMYSIPIITMVDDPKENYTDPVYELPLITQRYHGYFPYNPHQPYIGRFIHKYLHGNYTAGRHHTAHKFIVYPNSAFIMKFTYSPWNDFMKKRKLQIGPTLPIHSIQQGLGTQHVVSAKELDINFIKMAEGTQDLRLILEYQKIFSLHNK
ncbi:hypothetical protein CN553_28515 [Bacillus cereus]|uniref:Uncharacterized protein n=1 Tax=Bacillus cereus TaxID=1396 RepID=A0A9X6U6G7_BACCE|nr:hypothetical protein CN553_28515 [Bacillus cereus]